ncbi:ABC transporter ATP-binding protein [Actinomadura decatromicini]|uniref:ABC transporter ATP-binding protein n=1 Tax=Actinomadura decatromicini TaxID=2604572 RepID=A0A5D3FT10_9ACTN|nr:ABC transporter ATP-binding protein [Actinomadura decatromicini]TYK51188.1 ABC transporter ATP-binding protein [Actinomadura decatromicini]
MSLLNVRNLTVEFPHPKGPLRAVDGVSFAVEPGRTVGIVGESGSGKSATSLAIMGLHAAARIGGSIELDGVQLVGAGREKIRAVRGRRVAMIFQDPLSSLHPHFRVGEQIAEARRLHFGESRRAAHAHAVRLLADVGIPDPDERARDHPHRFSGGMRQRVMIAMALACEPDLLIADEPTTALDVTVQAQILELIAGARRERGLAVLMITHDLGVVARVADDVLVMYAGRVVEHADAETLFAAPRHPYTRGLLGSLPRLTGPAGELSPIPGSPPSPLAPPSGCPFHPRCPDRVAACEIARPELEGATHRAACHLTAAKEPR